MTVIARVARIALVVVAMAMATAALGWWGVVFAAAAFALIDGRRGSALDAAVAAGVSWAALLGVVATRGDVAGVARTIGGAVGIPPAALLVIAIAFPAALAWSCAAIVGVVRDAVAPQRRRADERATDR